MGSGILCVSNLRVPLGVASNPACFVGISAYYFIPPGVIFSCIFSCMAYMRLRSDSAERRIIRANSGLLRTLIMREYP